ncbi:MAG: hypothetical protein ABIM44_04915 [candidate division WOR-3 bacterium]
MIDRWFKKVRYFPEIRVETIQQNIPENTTVKIEEAKNIRGQLSGAKIAIIGIQAKGYDTIYHGFITDDEYYSEIHSLGLKGLDSCDDSIYYEASRNISITTRNIGPEVTNYGLRHTWVIWNPEKISSLANLPTPVYERFDMPLPFEARAVIERSFLPLRKEIYTFVGDIPSTSITMLSKFAVKPDEIFILEEFSATQKNVTVSIYREGETEAGASFLCSLLPADMNPVKLWLPAINEIKIELSSTENITSFRAKAKIKVVKPINKSVIPTIRVG